MIEVHQMQLRNIGDAYRATLLVRLSNGKLRSFTGFGATPWGAYQDAMRQAEEASGPE
jgi:hypothetical protein